MDRTIFQAKRLAVTVDIDDTTSALIDFKAGYKGYLGTMCAAPYIVHLRVLGTGAIAEARGDFTQLEVQRAGGKPEPVPLPPIDTLRAELEAFADACTGGPDISSAYRRGNPRQRSHGNNGPFGRIGWRLARHWIRWIGAEQMLRGKGPRRVHVRSGDMPDRR